MNNHKAAVMILNQADTLKAKLFLKNDILNEPDFRIEQYQLQTLYHQVLVLDLEYALDKKVEQELWSTGFKHYITILQEIIRDKKNPRRSDAQGLLTSSLQSASGFYLTLLQELYSRYNIDGPFKRKNTVYGQVYPTLNTENVKLPQTSSCVYICQYCLVHLGDIARYMNKRREAESFYKQAIKASPTSGHPYNQLALLEATQGDKLSTVFHYVRGIAVKNPFPATATNLANTFSSLIDKEDVINDIQTKMSVNDFIRLFLKAHGLLYTTTDLKQADLCVKSINATLTALVATQSFTSSKLIKMTVINLYALRHTIGDNNEELTTDEKIVKEFILDLLSGSLSAFLLPVYTLKNDVSLLDYYALPAIKLIFCWINKDPEILNEKVFANKLQIWPSFCKLLNNLEEFLKDFDSEKYGKVALSEDYELQGFLPLKESFRELDFKTESPESDIQKYIRAKRIINFGYWLTNINVNNTRLIIRKMNTDNKVVFEPGCIQPDPTDKLLEEMKSIELSDKTNKLKEKRGGILKPQGSLEKSREEREYVLLANSEASNPNNNSNNSDFSKLRRVKQNVALQSIFKKIEENKQVKFSNETADNEKEKSPKNKNSVKPPANVSNLAQLHHSQPYMTNASQQITNPQSNLQDLMTFGMPSRMNNATVDHNMTANTLFLNSDVTNQQNTQLIPPMHHHQQQQQQLFPNLSNPSHFSSNFPDNSKSFNQYPIDYNKTLFPQDRTGNAWNSDDRSQVQSWWSSNLQPPTNMPQHNVNYLQNTYMQNSQNYVQPKSDYYQNKFSFPNSVGPSQHSTMDGFKQNIPSEIGSGMWNTPTRNENVIGYNNMTVRQAMLNETKHMQNAAPNQPTNNVNANNIHSQNSSNIPGYSLFNSSSWTPNLPGQIYGRSNNTDNSRIQQSLFSNNGSQSLKQLLEQQNQLHKDDT